jgi:fructose-1,6-bisphosphatase/sedoheptulose 1,7-bisphosphatase-like protein
MGIKDPKKKYEIEDMVKGDCLFAATGVTTGPMLTGVKFGSYAALFGSQRWRRHALAGRR